MEYDSRGNLVRRQETVDFTTDGTIDTRLSTVNAYDSRGQLVQSTTEYDFNADGTLDQITVVTVTYDGVKP